MVLVGAAQARPLPVVDRVELQPLAAQAQRIGDALASLGVPLSAKEVAAITSATKVQKLQALLDKHALLGVIINPEQRVKVVPGPAKPELDENGWRVFLVKVINEAGTTAPLEVQSPQAAPMQRKSNGFYRPESKISQKDAADRWLDVDLYRKPPLQPELSGLEVEYRVLQVHCADRFATADRDPGPGRPVVPFKREAKIEFYVGQGTQDLGFRSEASILFTCRPSVEVKLRIRDHDGKPTMAQLVVRDVQGRVYPAQSRRLVPDFFFHPQVYRQDGETLGLPPGDYSVEYGRGPEYVMKKALLNVPARGPVHLDLALERWIDLASMSWISGDHYEDPAQGVLPKHMWRQMLGEDLRIGCALTWGPCYYYQKQFFSGKDDSLSTKDNLLRYDVEVSGFGSHRSGHLVLLRLKDQNYPGAEGIEQWPTLGLSVLRWAKSQGAVVGPAHSGFGIEISGTNLPSDEVPRFDGIGANEHIVQITHEVPGPGGKLVPLVDFMSAVDTPYTWEMNMWYHTLNAGFRTRLSGETDFPCIYGERVGMGRVYVKLDQPAKLDYDAWVAGLAAGRSYVTDGRSHLVDFTVGGLEVGTRGSELRLERPGQVRVTAKVAARLEATPLPGIKDLRPDQKPYWHLERARLGDSREVPLELLVNGRPVARQNISADGMLRDVSFDVPIAQSSWVAMRIAASSHTNPVFVLVDGKPIRASQSSVSWCLKSVDACWDQKERSYKPEELPAAREAYDHARKVYRKILAETSSP
jgi:hypothetical protein